MAESPALYRTIYRISDRPDFSDELFPVDIQNFICRNASSTGLTTTTCAISLSADRTLSVI